MKDLIRMVLCLAAFSAGYWYWLELPEPQNDAALAGGLLGALFFAVLRPRGKIIVQLAGMTWTEEELCQHVAITGATGSGKTVSGFQPLLVQVQRNRPQWGGMALGVKGDEHEFLSELFTAHGSPDKLINLTVRPSGAPQSWEPEHRFNLLSDRGLPWTAHAKAVVDTAASLTGGQQSAFFKPASQQALSRAFELLDMTGETVTVTAAFALFNNPARLEEAVHRLAENTTPAAREVMHYFENTFVSPKDKELADNIVKSLGTYLGFFTDPDIAEVFSSEKPDTFKIADTDHGKVITVSMPQRFVTERKYINTYLKILFYYHGLRRFELPKAEQRERNLLLLIADEFQDLVSATEDGISDHSAVDRVRSAKMAFIIGMQSEVSPDPRIGRDRRAVLMLNFRTRLIFTAADMEGGRASADFIGMHEVTKTSRSLGGGRPASRTHSKAREHRVHPDQLTSLKPHQAVVVHPTKKFTKRRIAPVDGAGRVYPWYRGF